MGPQRFILGSVVLSPNCRFASPFKRAADSQNCWRLSNMDAPVYVHRRAISPALHWRSNEREKKLSSLLAASSFFQHFRLVDLRRESDLPLICRIIQTDIWSKRRARFTKWTIEPMDHGGWHVSHKVQASNTKYSHHLDGSWRKNRFASPSERAAD